MKSVIVFVVGGGLVGALSIGIGYWLAGESILVQSGVAFGLTFVPAAGTLAWVIYSYRTAPEMQLLACLGSSGVRMAIAAGGGVFLSQIRPQTFDVTFWCWLLPFYFTLLVFEIILVVWHRPNEVRTGADAPR